MKYRNSVASLALALGSFGCGGGTVPDPAPPIKSGAADATEGPRPTPHDVGPALLNVPEIRSLLADFYPRSLRKQGIGGMVGLYIRIDRLGVVTEVRIKEPSVYNQFNKAVTRVVEAMHFRPAESEGQPIGVWVYQTIHFSTR